MCTSLYGGLPTSENCAEKDVAKGQRKCGDRFHAGFRIEDCVAMQPNMSFDGSLAMLASFLEAAGYLSPCPSTSCGPMESVTTSVGPATSIAYLALKHERLAAAESVETRTPVETFLGVSCLGLESNMCEKFGARMLQQRCARNVCERRSQEPPLPEGAGPL